MPLHDDANLRRQRLLQPSAHAPTDQEHAMRQLAPATLSSAPSPRRARPARRAALAAAVAGVSTLLSFSATGHPASAEPAPASPISLTLPASLSFTVGDVGGTFDLCGVGGKLTSSTALATLRYSATAPSGISGFDVSQVFAGAPPMLFEHVAKARPVTWRADNYNGDCGGGSQEQIGWRVTAHDNAGHSASKEIGYRLAIVRWDNANGVQDPIADTWSFSAGWQPSTCLCADGGTQNNTVVAGRSGTYTTRAVAGQHLGLMMATGPGRGKASISVDGKPGAVVDTFSPTNANRVYLWDSGALTAGTHTVRVVNQATPGRPRIDVNAMSVLQAS